MHRKSLSLPALDVLADRFPGPLYWTDQRHFFLGANTHALTLLGVSGIDELSGLTPLSFNPRHRPGTTRPWSLNKDQEAPVEAICNRQTGMVRYFNVIRLPLIDDSQAVCGQATLCTELPATVGAPVLAEADALILSPRPFSQLIDQFSHDMGSPLATLMMIVRICREIPEKERIALRGATNSIVDLVKALSSGQSRTGNTERSVIAEEREFILIAPFVLSLLNEKKYQYKYTGIKFDHQFTTLVNFAWIKIEPQALKRALSNIINNAVDALDHREGEIILHLDADEHEIYLTVEDNGKGMSEGLMQQIKTQIPVSVCRKNHHGQGLTQVREMLHNNYGEWTIDSNAGLGTNFTLIFPRSVGLSWLAEKIKLGSDDTVVVLDDDRAIHIAWDFRFSTLLREWPALQIKHFESGQQTITWINHLDPAQKQKLFLLADYELLGQDLNGLTVIQQTQLERSILVTSHYADHALQQLALKAGTRILPKELAPDLPVEVNLERPLTNQAPVNLVFVDDDQTLLNTYIIFAGHKKADAYYYPQHFLDKLGQYPLNTTILLDQHYVNDDRQGLDIARHLHEMGYTRLYLLSVGNLPQEPMPQYLTVIIKGDLEALSAVIRDS